MNPDHPHHPDGLLPPLPPMKTLAEATALAEKEHDPFYLTVFRCRVWLGELILQSVADYAEKKDPKTRSPQSGQAWRGLQATFGLNSQPSTLNSQLPARLLSGLFHFLKFDEPLAHLLRAGLVPLSIEHDCSGDYIGPKNKALLTPAPPSPSPVSQEPSPSSLNSQPSTLNSLLERSLIRWCDWLDAAVHYQTHAQWHWNPVCFDPDPDKRKLAILGALQRHLAELSVPAQAAWQEDFAAAATRFKGSPKWSMLGQAMSANSDRLWPYRQVDTLVISLWPLVRQHNWTYRDLLNIVRSALPARKPTHHSSTHSHSPIRTPPSALPWSYPCEREQDFAAYCINILGLRKSSKGITAKNGLPAGHDVAQRLCLLPTSPKP